MSVVLRPGPQASRCLHSTARAYHTAERHSSLVPETWIISKGDAQSDYRSTRVAAALNMPYHVKHTATTWHEYPIIRPFARLSSLLSKDPPPAANFRHIKDTTGEFLPRFAIAASKETLPALLEVRRRTRKRTMTVYLGLPDTKLTNIDALVLSRLDQLKLWNLGPGRANLDNAFATILPLSGTTAVPQPLEHRHPSVVVCIGMGIESTGFRLLSRDVDVLADGLLTLPSPTQIQIALSADLHPRLRPMIETRLISRLRTMDTGGSTSEPANTVSVLDYAQPGQPPLAETLAAASHVVATADNIPAVSLAVSLQRPVYIAGEERTTGLLRDYYHLLEKSNLVRRFYPQGSRYSYMLAPDISGTPDPFSAIRDHEPWTGYNAQADLDNVVAFIQSRYKEKNN
ncbi:hypothetical protein GGF46_004189 [Coemansia sp. RSA 552]|nr:hypothetical protein GGF46_004189 [Coemansia sp. RSA 552]